MFGIGLSRTGTTSLTEALRMLGLRAEHFPVDPVTIEEVTAYLGSDRRGPLALSCLGPGGLQAITDSPVCVSLDGLDQGYPGARFVLTVRDRPAWLDSCRRYWDTFVMPFLAAHGDEPAAGYIRAICLSLYDTITFDAAAFSRAYDDYHARVADRFRQRPGDLLRLDVCGGEGWAPLCRFLGRPVPAEPFPWEHAR